MTVYLDCNATTPLEPEVRDAVMLYLSEEYGNAGSRTHETGARAKKAVENARRSVAAVVEASPDEVIFTSGATESDNLAILGLDANGCGVGKPHIVTTAIEHKAVLEPVDVLEARGYEVTIITPGTDGQVSSQEVLNAIRDETVLVSVMHANNETGVLQPIEEIAAGLSPTGWPIFHVDAAQTFGKELSALRSKRIDLISVSGHKLYAPKGIGALIARKRDGKRPPLRPLTYGGGQELGLRPGTLPVHLIVGLGKAADIAVRDLENRRQRCKEIRERALDALGLLGIQHNGHPDTTQSHVLNISVPGVDSEAAMLAWKGLVEVSNGSACTSTKYEPSHVLQAMGLDEDQVEGAIRISWCHMTPEVDWGELTRHLRTFL
ncbi:cysteine desulfurase [Natronocella acetinitrilica]|uniref:cysteine desulfurase n=1 Tax=Natronocella acetinitrilica TaxID=414046 RepID=A0AAE3G7T6_9GAMM|nr:cysteine desulfurase DndA [Natronocella acetinitrilica]MCP1676634.1 cysteine desulfurase [Natronocella acetinitrilica]